MQRFQVVVDHGVVRDPSAHHQIGAQQWRHLAERQFHVRAAQSENVSEAKHVRGLDARHPAAGRDVFLFQQRECVGIGFSLDAFEAGAPEQQVDALFIDKAGHRSPCHAQDGRVVVGGVNAEAPHLDQLARKIA